MIATDTRSAFWSVFLGALLLLAGLIAIALPPIAGIAASVFFGWLLHGRQCRSSDLCLVTARSRGRHLAILNRRRLFTLPRFTCCSCRWPEWSPLRGWLAFYIVVSGIFEACCFCSPPAPARCDLVSRRWRGFANARWSHLLPVADGVPCGLSAH